VPCSEINVPMIFIRSISSKSFLVNLIVGAWILLPDLVVAQSCTGGTIQNTSNSSTSTLSDTANGQCLTNSGTITVPVNNMAFSLSYAQTSVLNSGTIILSGELSNAVYSWGGNSSVASIVNSGLITANTGSYHTIAIWLANGTGVVDSIVNSGQIYMNNTGLSVAIFNYVGNSITTLTNSGNISIFGQLYAIGNNSAITTLNNSGSIISSGNAHGISNNSGATIGTINNTGTIFVPTSGYYGVLNNSGATVGTLNNSQGSASTAGVLTYSGVLPSNYNIIVNSSSSYGQLSATSVTGSSTFGISSGTITSKLYSRVMQGLTTSNVAATRSGNYQGLNWTLALQGGSATVWDLIFTGGSTVDTQQSLVESAHALRSVFNQQSTVVNNSLNYDCTVFSENGICISGGGRLATTNNITGASTNTLLVAAWKVLSNTRVGAYVDQNVPTSSVAGISMNKNPMYGIFGVWNESPDAMGYEVRLSTSFSNQNLTQTRNVVGTSEAGAGSASLTSQAISGVVSYAMPVTDSNWIASPYAGVRKTRINRSGYTETNAVTAPLTYSDLNQEITTVSAGIRTNFKFSDKLHLLGNVGIEKNVGSSISTLNSTGVTGLISTDFSANYAKTRPVGSVGVSYAVTKDQRISLIAVYRKEAFQSSGSTTSFLMYQVGL
jgi:hypothetical protein